jgi:hypothetical protein
MRTPSTDRIDQLALVWLLVPRKKGGPAEFRKQLENVVPGADDRKRLVDACVARLRDRGMVEPRRFVLTEEGRKEALRVLGVPGLPSKKPWEWAKKLLLLRSIDGGAMPAAVNTAVSSAGRADVIAARVVARRYKLDRNLAGDPSKVLAALALRALEVDEHPPFSFAYAFSEIFLGAASIVAVNEDSANSQFANVSMTASLKLAECKLPDFASTVIDAARSSVTGRWHDAVFISHVWKTLRARGDVGITFKDFQRRLIEAHQDELVELSRADLVEAMPAADVSASETVHSGARFHFIRVEQLAS